MLIIKRYLSFALGVLTFIFLEVFIFFPKSLVYISPLYLILLILSLWYLQKKKLERVSRKIAYLVLPVILISNWVSFLTFLTFHKFFLHLLALIAAAVMWLYIESAFLKHYFIRFYKPRSWENLSEEVIILSAFLMFVNFFSFKVYINWNVYILFIISGVILLLLTWIHLAFNHFLKGDQSWIYLFVIPILSLETLFVSTFLPTNFYSLALVNTLLFYLLIIFSRYHLSGRFSVKMVRQYLSLSAILLLIILLVSNWT